MRAFRLILCLFVAMAFAAPAFESHACASEGVGAAEVGQVLTDAQDREACPDCGPACAGGCCHAPHPAVAGGDLAVADPAPVFADLRPWTHSLGLPMGLPDGPERPPRL